MGPRSNDRGNADAGEQPLVWEVASMGPRSNDRGNKANRLKLRNGDLLQWGRDQMIAEMRRLSICGRIGKTLQWGRDQMIAEMGWRPARKRPQ